MHMPRRSHLHTHVCTLACERAGDIATDLDVKTYSDCSTREPRAEYHEFDIGLTYTVCKAVCAIFMHRHRLELGENEHHTFHTWQTLRMHTTYARLYGGQALR